MRKHAFTLIELLVVVAIIAILAAIAVPNFLEAQTRARVSRTENDLRTIDLAMESYRIDDGGYGASYAARVHNLLPTSTAAGNDIRLLSTPIAYLDSMPPDIFRVIAGLGKPGYWVYGVDGTGASHGVYPKMGWMTWSNGPDQTTQTGSYRSLWKVLENEALPAPLLGMQTPAESGGGGTVYNGMRYDPTNGTVSVGDIYRFGGLSKTFKR